MPAIYIHVSDIHFGQEKDDAVHTHDAVKDRVISDAAAVVRSLPGKTARGIIVTGDIAQSGKKEQYQLAGEWLDRLATAVGSEIFDILMVPGNHDFDRDKVSQGAEFLLRKIHQGEAAEYERIVRNDADRASLFARFEDYCKFCRGYNCALDEEGKHSANDPVEIAPGRFIRFVMMNSAICCTGTEKHDDPVLFVGARQFARLPEKNGEENILLIHHPLSWFKDKDDATPFIRNRTRVLISGHEHNPKVFLEEIEPGRDLLTLAAGATVPFRSNDEYTYTYNIILFDWDSNRDALSVTIYPRAWNPEFTRFEADTARLGGRDPCYILGSPNFRNSEVVEGAQHPAMGKSHETLTPAGPSGPPAPSDIETEGEKMPDDPGIYRLVLLRFFRDLTEAERLRILHELEAIPDDLDEFNHVIEQELLDHLVDIGKLTDVHAKIDALISSRSKEEK